MIQAMAARRSRVGSILGASFAVATICGITAAVAGSLALGLRRPLVTPLAGICGLMLLIGLGGLVFPRDPAMPAAMWPGIVAAAIALLVLAPPPVRARLPE